jgi:hypothetical protein
MAERHTLAYGPSHSSYVNGHCRCSRCTAANTEYQANRRRANKKAGDSAFSWDETSTGDSAKTTDSASGPKNGATAMTPEEMAAQMTEQAGKPLLRAAVVALLNPSSGLTSAEALECIHRLLGTAAQIVDTGSGQQQTVPGSLEALQGLSTTEYAAARAGLGMTDHPVGTGRTYGATVSSGGIFGS